MAMEASDIEQMIKEALPDATVEITDLAGDGDHYAAKVTSQAFEGKSRVQQHQMVYGALKGNMGGVLHALQLETAVPEASAADSDIEGSNNMSEQEVHDWLRTTVAQNDVVVFMKGTPKFPQCGFSGQVAQIMEHLGVEYKDVNVLDDMGIREGVKSFSDWPTIPQLYVKGEFVGGCDIIREMTQAGELQTLLKTKEIPFNEESMIA